VVSIGHLRFTDDYFIIVSSNIRDNDQALYLMTPTGQPLEKLTTFPGGETVITYSPNGQWLIFNSDVNRNYYSLNMTTHTTREIIDSNSTFFTFTPSQPFVYFTHRTPPPNWSLFRINLRDSRQQPVFVPEYDPDDIYISPDKQWAFFYRYNRNLTRIHIPTATVETLPFTPATQFSRRIIGWSADSQWLYIEEFDGNAQVYRITVDGQQVEHVLDRTGHVPLAFSSPDGKWTLFETDATFARDIIRFHGAAESDPEIIANGRFEGWTDNGKTFLLRIPHENSPADLCRMDIATAQCLNLTPNIAQILDQSPTRDQIIFDQYDPINYFRRWFLLNADGTSQREIAHGRAVEYRGWSPDGQWLYFDEKVNQQAVLFRVNANTGHREDIHQPYGDNNAHPMFQTFIPLYQSKSFFLTSLVLMSLILIGTILMSLTLSMISLNSRSLPYLSIRRRLRP
jgi:Tol biopolymer transport system component